MKTPAVLKSCFGVPRSPVPWPFFPVTQILLHAEEMARSGQQAFARAKAASNFNFKAVCCVHDQCELAICLHGYFLTLVTARTAFWRQLCGLLPSSRFPTLFPRALLASLMQPLLLCDPSASLEHDRDKKQEGIRFPYFFSSNFDSDLQERLADFGQCPFSATSALLAGPPRRQVVCLTLHYASD